MSVTKKITINELRNLIAEAMTEDDADVEAEEADAEAAKAEEEEEKANESVDSEDVILERWRKLAGILRG